MRLPVMHRGMRILLFGANGQVGTELRRSLAPLGELVVATRNGQLPDGTSVRGGGFRCPADAGRPDRRASRRTSSSMPPRTPRWIAPRSDAAAAFRANAEAPARIADACAARDALLVHYSTDYVFDGTSTRPYREDDPDRAARRLRRQQARRRTGDAQASGARHMIFRTAWVYAAHGHNFLRTMLRLAAERDELRVVADQVGVADAGRTDRRRHRAGVARQPLRSGLWHLVADGQTSWHGFAEAIIAGAQHAA